MDKQTLSDVRAYATRIRIGIIDAIGTLGFGHAGGSLSIADTLAVLYGHVMRVDPKNPDWAERDKLVCSKGHAGPAVYATLALKGYFPYELLHTLNKPGTTLPSHCDRNKTPGVDMTTGSLGQGSSAAMGIAMADKLLGRDSRTFLILGDGELNEGQVWEAAMFAAAKQLDNVYVLVDENKKQLDGDTCDVLPSGDNVERFKSFGFDAVRINGNDCEAIINAIDTAAKNKGVPHAIILDTIKGAGIDEIASMKSNHSITLTRQKADEYIAALNSSLAGGSTL